MGRVLVFLIQVFFTVVVVSLALGNDTWLKWAGLVVGLAMTFQTLVLVAGYDSKLVKKV